MVTCCYQSRATKDSGKECVILMDNKRVEIGNKSIWSSESYARRIIRKFATGNHWHLDNSNIWYYSMNNNNTPPDIEKVAASIRQEWIDKHLRVMPLREYMVFEHRRIKNKR